MVKLFKSISSLLLFLFLIPGNSFAQFSLFGGASLPVGSFGGTSFTSSDDGFAKLGLNFGIQNDLNITSSINWTTSAIFSLNSFNASEMEKQFNQITGSGIKVDGSSYNAYWLLTGLGLESSTSSSLNMFIQGQVGFLFSKMPDITFSNNSVMSNAVVTQTADMAITFAYGIGGGIKISNVILGIRYYYGKPQYTEIATLEGQGQSATMKVSLPASIVCFDIGYSL